MLSNFAFLYLWCSLIRVQTVKFSQNFLKCTWIYMYAAAVIWHKQMTFSWHKKYWQLMGTSCANICWTSLCHLCLYLVTLRCLRWLPVPIILSPEIDMCLHMQVTVCGLVWSRTFMAFFFKNWYGRQYMEPAKYMYLVPIYLFPCYWRLSLMNSFIDVYYIYLRTCNRILKKAIMACTQCTYIVE